MTSRPVWLTREQRDKCHRFVMDDVVAAWDAAPADPAEAACAALEEIAVWADGPLDYTRAVLRALGCPDPEPHA